MVAREVAGPQQVAVVAVEALLRRLELMEELRAASRGEFRRKDSNMNIYIYIHIYTAYSIDTHICIHTYMHTYLHTHFYTCIWFMYSFHVGGVNGRAL